MKKAITLIIFLIVLIGCTFIYLTISTRTLHITGYALKGDKVTVTINGKGYSVENYSKAGKPMLNYLYQEVQYRSFKNDDIIHIKIDSNKFKLLDTNMVLNNSNIYPRIFFAEPYSYYNIRKVFLINDSALLRE